jgi:hypothetical protein
MFCVNCGTEITGDIKYCPQCGIAVESAMQTKVNSTDSKRHSFTSFWLVFSLIGYFVMPVKFLSRYDGNIFEAFYYIFANGDINPLFIVFYVLAIPLLGTTGNILLLCRKKIGFWIVVGGVIYVFLAGFLFAFPSSLRLFGFGDLLYYTIFIAIMYFILNINMKKIKIAFIVGSIIYTVLTFGQIYHAIIDFNTLRIRTGAEEATRELSPKETPDWVVDE